MKKLKEFLQNDNYINDPVMCRKIQFMLEPTNHENVVIRIMGVEVSGRRMTGFYEYINTKSIDKAIPEWLDTAGLKI